MTVTYDLEETLRNVLPSNETMAYIAFLGDASHTVKAPKGENNVYVIKHDRSVEIVKNTRVANVAKLQVVVGYDKTDPTVLQVLRTVNAYIDPPYPPVANHAELMHGAWGYDPVWVRYNQILPGLATPAANTGLTIALRGFSYYLDGWHALDNQVIDMTSHVPASGARWTVVEIDNTQTLLYRYSDSKPSRELLLPEDIPTLTVGRKQLFAVRTYFGQVRIIYLKDKLSDIFDMRFSGVATGGTATDVAWDDVTGKPTEFPPDLDITDALYPRKWYKLVAPSNNDDTAHGYHKLDHWIDTTTGKVYTCTDDTSAAAVWLENGAGGSGAGGGLSGFVVDGALAATEEATSPLLIPADMAILQWRIYLRATGVSGETKIDLIRKRTGEADVSVFWDGVTDTRPVVAWDDADHVVIATPLETDFLENDTLELSIVGIAPESSDLVVIPDLTVSIPDYLEVTDGVTSITHTKKISVEGLTVTDMGSGEAKISVPAPFIPDLFVLPVSNYASTVNYGLLSGGGYGLWLQSSGAQNDEVIWNINLPAGTYALVITHVNDTNRGIYHWFLNGDEIGTADGYGGWSSVPSVLTISGGVVSTDGVAEIKIKMNTKNPSSSAYYGTILGLSLIKTA